MGELGRAGIHGGLQPASAARSAGKRSARTTCTRSASPRRSRFSRALACARENLERLGLAERVQVVRADLFPADRAALAGCNPPWIPARPSSPIERGIYDPESRMLRGLDRQS